MGSNHQAIFRQQIHEFFEHDMESCFKASRAHQNLPHEDLSFKGGLNFTAALVVLSIIDMMAGFFHGKTQPSLDEIASFIQRYFSKYEPFFRGLQCAKLFYKVFRHGLAHEWSPKASAVGMDFSSDVAIGICSQPEGEAIMGINIPKFYELTTKALSDYERDLNGGYHTKEFERRYNEQIKRDCNEMRKLRELYGDYARAKIVAQAQ